MRGVPKMFFSVPATSNNRKKFDLDEKLFEKIGNGDMEAFRKLYEETERIMYGYILTLSKNHDDALDILQDTFLKIKSASHLYKASGKPLAWMFTIAKNLFYEKLRRDKRFVSIDDTGLESITDLSFVTNTEDRVVLESALNILSDEDREIVIMYVIGEMKHREIAKMMNIGLSTELSRYRRALKKIKSEIESRDIIYED